MTKIERVLAMIYGKEVDKLPKGEFFVEDGLITKLLQVTSLENPVSMDFRAKVKAYELLGLDALVVMADHKNSDHPWIELEHWQQESDFFLFAMIDGPFQGVGHGYTDFTAFLMDTVRDQDKVEKLVQRSFHKSLELGRAAIASGAHGLLIADDIAYNHGLYVSPRTMRESFFPYLRQLVQGLAQESYECGGKEIPIFFHSDGDIQLVLRDLKDMAFAGIHSLDSVMDLAKIREAVGRNMCLMGGYSLGWFDTDGVSKVDEILHEVMPGRYIFGSSAGILDSNLTPQAVLAVYQYVDGMTVRLS